MAGKRGQTFKAEVHQWADSLQPKLDALVRQTIQKMSLRVVTTTPVDTGFLRGSWQPSIGEPYSGPSAAGGSSPIQDGQAKIALVVPAVKAGDIFYMRNNAAYAKRMEWGFVGRDSLGRNYNQPGRFFVTDAVKAWQSIAAETAKELGL